MGFNPRKYDSISARDRHVIRPRRNLNYRQVERPLTEAPADADQRAAVLSAIGIGMSLSAMSTLFPRDRVIDCESSPRGGDGLPWLHR